jgi:hypothetical protein
MEVLNNIPISFDTEQILRMMRARGVARRFQRTINELIEIARPIARPKAVYEVGFIDSRDGDTLKINGIRFTSHVMKINLEKVERVFPFIVTCGTELEEVKIPARDTIRALCWDAVKAHALGVASRYLQDYLKKRFALGELSHMNPGSLDSWPVTQQKELFSLFGDVEKLTGVRLTEGLLMYPIKSVSGIYFSTGIKFENCQLCPVKKCPSRRAPYDPELVKKYAQDELGSSAPQ